MAPHNVSPVSSGGHLSQGIVQGGLGWTLRERDKKKGSLEPHGWTMMSFNDAPLIINFLRPFCLCCMGRVWLRLGGGVKTAGSASKDGLASDLSETLRPRRGRGERVPPGTSGLHFS